MNKLLRYRAVPSHRGESATWSGFRPASDAHQGVRGRHSRPRWSGDVINAGFTLLEIILALTILAGSLVALGEVMRLADQNASDARDETEAEILASSVMDGLLSGERAFQAYDKQDFDFETDPRWVFSVLIEPTTYSELVRVGVRVEQPIESEKEPVHVELYRWILNPDYVAQLEQEEADKAAQAAAAAESAAAAASSTGSGTGTGGTGTGTTGGGGGG